MTVSLASEVSLESTAPAIVPESRAAIGPTLSDAPQPAIEQPAPRADTAPTPDRVRPETPRTQTPRPRPSPTAAPAPQTGGGSLIGDSFLDGAGSSQTSDDARIPASQIGASAQASLRQAINRQIRPHWNAPSGVDAEQLVTILSFRLNEDGSLAGRPRVVRQAGINASNRPQSNLHAERAIRAVQLASPFDLPPEYYNAWRNVSEWRFDRRL